MNTNRRKNKNLEWIARDKYGGDISKITSSDILRLKKGEPVDYIIGWTPFLDCIIDLSKHPLIPRPETEYWVKNAIENIEFSLGSREKKFHALDIFAGSGCIGVAVLKHFPNAYIDFVDIDAQALAQIKINAKQNNVLSCANIIRSNGFKNIKKQYDYIFANPPYIDELGMEKLPVSVKKYEPPLALFGGKDGMDTVTVFLAQVFGKLKPNGVLWMEFGAGQKGKIQKIIHDISVIDFEFLRDQYGKWRTVKVQKQ